MRRLTECFDDSAEAFGQFRDVTDRVVEDAAGEGGTGGALDLVRLAELLPEMIETMDAFVKARLVCGGGSAAAARGGAKFDLLCLLCLLCLL